MITTMLILWVWTDNQENAIGKVYLFFYYFSSHCKLLWYQELFVESLTYLAEKVSSGKTNVLFNTTFTMTVVTYCLQTAACRHNSWIQKRFL